MTNWRPWEIKPMKKVYTKDLIQAQVRIFMRTLMEILGESLQTLLQVLLKIKTNPVACNCSGDL